MKESSQKDSVAARDALEMAALLGEEFSLAVLISAGATSEGLDKLFDEECLVEVEAGRARFADPARAIEIAASLSWSRKRFIHGALARACAAHRLPPADVAAHYLAARDFAEARPLLIRAAEKACLQRRFRPALALIRQALDIWPIGVDSETRLRILHEMARCAMNCREDAIARLAWEEILEMTSDPGRCVEALRQLAALEQVGGELEEAGRHLEQAARLAEEKLPAADAAQCWLAWADYLANRLLVTRAREAAQTAREHAEKSKSHALISETVGYCGLVAAMGGRAEEASDLADLSLRIAVDHDLPEQTALAYRRRANICEYAADYTGEAAAHLQAISYCRSLGERSGEISCLSCLANACFRTGEWKDALETANSVLKDRKAHPAYHAIARMVPAMIAAFRGEQRTAGKLLERNLLELRRLGLAGLDFQLLWARAFYFENEGDFRLAASSYDELRVLWRACEDRHLALSGLLFASSFYKDQGRVSDVSDCLDILHVIVRDNSNPESRATLRAVSAETAWAEDDKERAGQEFSEAAELFEKAKLPLETAWIYWRRTQLPGDPAMIREAARRAARIASQLGLRPLLARLATAKTSSPTRRQREVLDLLAIGLTGKEIASRLNLSPRTVEMHVARLLESLNCRTRAEAVRKATERGWV